MTSRAYVFNTSDFAFEIFANEVVVLNVVEGAYFAFGGSTVDLECTCEPPAG
jgi:hypothetical protein